MMHQQEYNLLMVLRIKIIHELNKQDYLNINTNCDLKFLPYIT